MTKELPPDEIDEDELSRSSPEANGATGDVPGEFAEASDAPPKIKRRPGRPPGLAKTGGRRKRDVSQEALDARIRESGSIELLIDVVEGRKVFCASPEAGHKDMWVRGTLAQRIRCAETLAAKYVPDRRATEVTGKAGAPLIPAPQLSTHETAKAMLDLLRESGLRERVAGGTPNIQTFSHPQLLAGVIDHKQHLEPAPSELERAPAAAELTAPAAAVEPKREYQVGETEVFDNGAYIQLVEIAGSNARKWDIRDELNAPYGYSSDRQAAVTRARAIKRSGSGEQG
jgi:hypothetical protein